MSQPVPIPGRDKIIPKKPKAHNNKKGKQRNQKKKKHNQQKEKKEDRNRKARERKTKETEERTRTGKSEIPKSPIYRKLNPILAIQAMWNQ